MTETAYETLLNTHALIEYSVNGHVMWANKNFLNLFGYSFNEIVGKHHSIFLPEYSNHQKDYQEMWSQLQEGRIQTGEFVRLGKNDLRVWVHGSYNPIKDEEGRVLKIITMAIDITEKKTLAENLEIKNRELQIAATKARAATQAKSAFLANMSHEIRTPLNSIIGITDTLAETSLDTQQLSFVEILQRANHQLMTIINDILDLTKVESGEIHIEKQPFNLKEVINDVIAVLDFRAKEKGLQLRVKIDSHLASYYQGDADRIRQVLINLIGNSIKFTHQGFISLEIIKNTTPYQGNILFRISDSGIGIPKQSQRDIFRAFTQAESATNRRYGGTGLGLSISQRLVDLMKGHIWLESDLGSGSVFYFTVAIPELTESGIISMQIKDSNKKRNEVAIREQLNLKQKILIVDDVEDNRHLLGIYLRNSIHEVFYAESGIEALKLIEQNCFDLILMDVQMPGMDGYETTQLARELEKSLGRNPCRIFACTANAFKEDVEKSLQAGCDQHLSKPIRKDTLMKVIGLKIPT